VIADFGIPATPRAIGDILTVLSAGVETPGVAVTSPRHLGYIPGGGLYSSALGDYLAAVSNRYAGLASVNPGAAQVENVLVRWLADVLGLPGESGGTLTSGGSLAHLTAIHAARQATSLSALQAGRSCVYLTEHTHLSVSKALEVCGLDSVRRRIVDVDDCYRMSPAKLSQLVAEDLAAGLRPWLVVITAGSTNTGAIDPLEQLAEVAGKYDLWMHVDGAYGALFNLCPEGHAALVGIDASDTVVVDPHKTLFLPYGTGAVLARDSSVLREGFGMEADYLPQENAEGFVSPANLSLELTRHFRGLRLWLPLQLAGVQAFAAALSEKVHLARYFHRRLSLQSGFELGPFPDLSIVTYRYVPAHGDADAFNLALARHLREGGRVFVSSTRLRGQTVLRAAILSFRTHRDDVDEALDAITGAARTLVEE
jgi:glutamate/tyrosine decarboxylase-like PLP-dependent enzyme